MRKKLHWRKLSAKRLAKSIWSKLQKKAEEKVPSPRTPANPIAAAILKNAADRRKRGKAGKVKSNRFELDSREIKETSDLERTAAATYEIHMTMIKKRKRKSKRSKKTSFKY